MERWLLIAAIMVVAFACGVVIPNLAPVSPIVQKAQCLLGLPGC